MIIESVDCLCFAAAARQFRICVGRRRKELKEDLGTCHVHR